MTPGASRAAPWPLGRALALFAAAWLALTWPWLSGQVTIPWDAKAHFQAQLQFLATSLHEGQSPFWNPYVFAGTPQIADPQALIFSPPYLVLAWLDPAPSFAKADAVAFAMLGLGALALMLLFRDRRWHWIGALVAALAFAFGGSAAWRVQHTGQILSLSYLPMALWLLGRALARGSIRAGLASGVAAGLMALGRDQVAWLGLWFLGGFALWTLFSRERLPDNGRPGQARALAAGFAGGLAVMLWPLIWTVLLAGDSNRPAIELGEAGKGSLHPAALLTLFSANLFGVDGPLAEFWGPASMGWGPTDLYLARNMSALYAGALSLLALIPALWAGRLWANDIRFFSMAAILTLLYALGWYTPVFALLFAAMPGADLFRRPADASFLLGLELAILAGYSVGRIADGTLKLTPRLTALSAATLGLVLCAALATAAGKQQLAYAAPKLGQSLAWLALGAGLLWLLARFAPSRPLLIAVAATLGLTADLSANNGPNESTALPPAQFDVLRPDTRNETIALLREKLAAGAAPDRRDRIEFAGVDFHWPNASMAHRFDNTLGYNPLRLAHYSLATGAGDHVALPEQREFSPLFPTYRSKLADLLGLRFIVTRVPVEQMDKRLQPGDLTLIARTADGYVYENPRAMPRVFFAYRAQAADFALMLRDGVWPDVDLATTALLEAPIADPPPPDAGPGRARILAYANTRVSVEAASPSGGYVMLADVWHPWWYAEIDGEAVPLPRADVVLRAVRVPPGTHRVDFVFRPFRGALDEIAARLQASRSPSARLDQ